MKGVLGAATAGLLLAGAACSNGSPELGVEIEPGVYEPASTEQAVNALHADHAISAFVVDKVVFPEAGIQGEEGAYYPLQIDNELVAAVCEDDEFQGLETVDTGGAEQIVMAGTQELEPFREEPAGPMTRRVIELAGDCRLALRDIEQTGSAPNVGDQLGSVAYAGTPRG
jgi:hypothetical protein